jgi:uncharacterized protein involved in exopolysaccharide biosynthesis
VRSRTLLRVWGPIALFVALCVAAAAAYVELAPRHYRAEAEVLVSPIAADDERYAGLPVLRAPTAVADAAELARASSLAESVRERLGLRESAAEVQARIRVHPVLSSSVVEIAARSSDPELAVKLANSFADLLVAQRTATLNTAIVDATTRTFNQLIALPSKSKGGPKGAALRARLARLRALSGSSDPSLRILSHALRGEEVRPRAAPIVLGALGGSILLGGTAGVLATRRRRPGREYDLGVSERVVAQLEQRLAERIEALLGEQERLVAREAELVERERALASDDTAHDARTQGLEERLKALTTRELELVKRAGVLAARENEFSRREEDLAAREQRIAAREEELKAYAQELEQLARDVETRRAEVEARAEELERRAAELAERAAPPPAWQPVAAVPEPPPLPENVSELPQRPGQWNLNELSRLVEERGAAYPERQDEWQSYLFFLRSYAEPDGTIPASFDWLIEEQFGVLTSGAA